MRGSEKIRKNLGIDTEEFRMSIVQADLANKVINEGFLCDSLEENYDT